MSSINLSWDADGTIDSYTIYRSESPMSVESFPAPLAENVLDKTYSDTTVVTGTTYYYRVASVANGAAKVSDEVMIKASTWSPAEITTALWFDAADASTINLSGGKVSQWSDKSGNARHATQSNATYMPAYDATAKYVRATGAGETLNGTFGGISAGSVNEYTIFMVVKPNKTSSELLVEANSGVGFYIGAAQNNIVFSAYDTDSESSSGVLSPYFSVTSNALALTETRSDLAPPNVSRPISLSFGSTLLVGITRSASAILSTRLFGVAASAANPTVTSMGWATFALPSTYTSAGRYNGDINEVILIHSGSLDLLVLQKIEGYLAHKWGIADNLVSGHPYKSTPP